MPDLFMSFGQGRSLYLMRGISGCGKTHRAIRLAAQYDAPIFSADDFFGQGEEYKKNWSPQKLFAAHSQCENKCLEAMKAKKNAIIVDNTNVIFRDFRIYLDYAVDHGYDVFFVYPDSPWWKEKVYPFLQNKNEQEAMKIALLLQEKNTHGVPASTISKILMRFQNFTCDDYLDSAIQRVNDAKGDNSEVKARLEKIRSIYL